MDFVRAKQNLGLKTSAAIGTKKFVDSRGELVRFSRKKNPESPSLFHILEELTFEEVQKRFVNKVLEMDGKRQETR